MREERYAAQLKARKYFYQSDVLIHALSAALTANSTVVKNAMEQYIAAIGGTAMPLTDSFGKTKAENLALGLYLIVETKVPENVVSTTDPFLISLPMTSVNGTNATDGGTRWIYDVTVYPKNQTGDPTLEKTLRESKTNTGKNNGTSGITDGYSQSQQLMSQTGCIGHLRGDFGSGGEQFFSSWDDHRGDLKSEDFKHEFDEVINALREDAQYGGVLKNRSSLSAMSLS